MQHVKQDKSETYNYIHTIKMTKISKKKSKVKLHGLAEPLNLISLGISFLYPLGQRITDLLFQTNRSKHL